MLGCPLVTNFPTLLPIVTFIVFENEIRGTLADSFKTEITGLSDPGKFVQRTYSKISNWTEARCIYASGLDFFDFDEAQSRVEHRHIVLCIYLPRPCLSTRSWRHLLYNSKPKTTENTCRLDPPTRPQRRPKHSLRGPHPRRNSHHRKSVNATLLLLEDCITTL